MHVASSPTVSWGSRTSEQQTQRNDARGRRSLGALRLRLGAERVGTAQLQALEIRHRHPRCGNVRYTHPRAAAATGGEAHRALTPPTRPPMHVVSGTHAPTVAPSVADQLRACAHRLDKMIDEAVSSDKTLFVRFIASDG
eukprot:COSAG06_NODE_419_length_15981_cov_12.672019_1_plen_140_part_00